MLAALALSFTLATCEAVYERTERLVHVQAVKAGIPKGQRRKAAQRRSEAVCSGEAK